VSHLLDTNVVIGILRGNRQIISRLNRHSPADLFIPSITLHELYYGAFRSERSAKALRDVDQLAFTVLDFGPEDARLAGNIRYLIAKAGQPIGPMDVLIAGQALARDLTLVTRNTREFGRVEGLRVENWEA
jgi:tRNA(fMet)-specific endonuclease VapC